MKSLILTCCLLALIGAAGCHPTYRMYDWKEYSSTLYKYKKSPDEKTAAAHKEMLLSIIKGAPKIRKKVPPGVYCEYGYMLLKENKPAEAKEYFELEAKTYPESEVFIKMLIADMDKNQEKK